MTVGVGRRKLSPVLLVLCIAGLLRSATAALNTPTCPAVLDAYTGGASLDPLNSGQQHTFSTTGVIQVRLDLTFGSNIDTNQVFFLFGAETQCGGLIGDVTTGGNLRISVNCNENDSDLGLSSGTGAVSPNTRYVIDYVYNQVTKLAEIYLDGVQIASGTKNWNEKVLDGYISVGDESHASTVNAFQGTLHEVSMHDCGGRFTDKATLQSAVDACLLAVPSGCAEISDYDVSLVTDMSELFKDKAEFNADISAWNTSQVTDMNNMFGNAFAFNQDIGSWNTAQVTSMNAMFRGATAFNQDIGSWNTGQVTSMGGMFYDAWAFNGAVVTWNTAQVTDMADVFRHAAAFNQDISSWNTSQVTDMRYMFKEAAAFYQDITGWSDASLTTEMFAGATAWLDRIQRRDGTGTSGPISEWVHKPCLVNERVQSGWCVPCGGMFSNAAGDDPAAGVDTACDGDSQGLKDAVNACLSAVPSGEACCSTDTNCADPSSARCGSAGCVDMPEWDVSLVTDMSELFKDKADFNVDISAWDTSQVTDMGLMFGNAFAFNQDISSVSFLRIFIINQWIIESVYMS